MKLQNGDTFKIYQYNAAMTSELLLASFSHLTTCKSNPSSCGQFLGQYSTFNRSVRLVFESSGGTRLPQSDAIWIDTTYIAYDSAGGGSCPALNGEVEMELLCEPGDRVHCPATYESPVTPEQTKPAVALAQGSSLSNYKDTCIRQSFIFPTTLQPGSTAIVPLVTSESYFANYATSKSWIELATTNTVPHRMHGRNCIEAVIKQPGKIAVKTILNWTKKRF